MPSLQELRAVPLFNSFHDEKLAELIAAGETLSLGAGQVVFREGADADSLYVVLSGHVKIYKRDSQGNEVELSSCDAGGFFGELGLLDGFKRSATVATVSPSELFVLRRESFLQLVAASPVLLERVLLALAQNVRNLNERFFAEELEKRTMEAQLEIERLRALSQLVAGVAHELNTPLGIINTALSIITQRLNSDVFKTVSLDRKARSAWDDVLEAARLAEGNIQRAHRLVQSFKNISVSQLTDSRENLDIVDALNETLTLFSINARRAHLALELRDDLGGHSHTWLGYRGYLSQVLLNLLTNVERYAYPDGAGGRVEISIGADDERAVRCYLIGVRDFGHGIAPEHLPKVFDPFFTTGRGSGGTGLGLAIVHNIVTSALKGTIAVESSLGQGTRFTLTVPQTIPDEIRTL